MTKRTRREFKDALENAKISENDFWEENLPTAILTVLEALKDRYGWTAEAPAFEEGARTLV